MMQVYRMHWCALAFLVFMQFVAVLWLMAHVFCSPEPCIGGVGKRSRECHCACKQHPELVRCEVLSNG